MNKLLELKINILWQILFVKQKFIIRCHEHQLTKSVIITFLSIRLLLRLITKTNTLDNTIQ